MKARAVAAPAQAGASPLSLPRCAFTKSNNAVAENSCVICSPFCSIQNCCLCFGEIDNLK